jgi:Na+/proline symporter
MAQRMLASKSEKDALGAVLFFNIAHYVLRPWPWILVGLCSLIVYPQLSDIQRAFPAMDPAMLGHDIAYPAMLKFLPVGFVGLMVGGLIAANSSTILTHLNWGSSYLVHDFYRRFIRRDAPDRHYVTVGRWATVLLFVCSSATVYLLDSAKNAFDIILQVGAGTGMLYLLRWFWWRINAWCEVVAMVTSFGTSLTLIILQKQMHWALPSHHALLLTIAVTTVCWVTTAFIAPQTDRATLLAFYKKVRPFGPGWGSIAAEAGPAPEGVSDGQTIPAGLLGWSAGCTVIWSSLFMVGNFLYGRTGAAVGLLVVFVLSGLVLIRSVKRLWN